MLFTDDLAVDETDDVIVQDGDFVEDFHSVAASMHNARRRTVSRSDDMIFSPEICAGIEVFLQSYLNDITLSEIEQDIRYCLTNSSLFDNRELNIYFDTTQGGKLGVIIKFNIPNLTSSQDQNLTFSTYIDIQNQRSFL